MNLKELGAAGSAADDPSQSSSPAPDAAVGELISSLNRRKLSRDVTLALRSGLRDATAEFSFLRLRGLRSLLKFLHSIVDSDASVRLFHQSQSLPELQVVPVIFQNSLRQSKDNPVVTLDCLLGAEPMKIVSPAADYEVALSLRVLEGCCLLHSESADLAHKYKAVKVLTTILTTGGVLEQGACLDALIPLMLESKPNQMDFEECYGMEKITDLMKDEQADKNIRLKCGEFLLLLIGHVSGRENPPLATIHEDIRQLLGEKCASLIWAASQFGSTLDSEQKQIALNIQARRVIEALELY